MFGLPAIDLIVIVLYFLVIIGIGIWSMRRIKNQEDYFLAGRRFGKFIQTFASFGQSTSVDTCVGVTTTTFKNGAGGIWSSLIYLPATPIYWMVMPWMRRLRLMTLGDFFEERYGSKTMAGVYSIIGTIGMMAILSVGFSAMTKTIVALTPKPAEAWSVAEQAEYQQAQELDRLQSADYESLDRAQKNRLDELLRERPSKLFSYIDQGVLVWVVCIVVMLYAVSGGLEAAFITDTVQGIFIIILSVILIPFSLAKINSIYGGSGPMDALRTLHQRISESNFEIFGSASNIDFTWYYIGALVVMGAINVVIQPNSLVVTGSAKDEYTCRFGLVSGCFMKRFVTVFWGFFALTAIVLYHDEVQNPDLVWGYATLDLLGPLKIGLVGLMIACLMAALMSTADCLMITCSGLLTHNLYRPLNPLRSERHYVMVGRVIGGLVVIGGALLATQFDTILQILKFMWEFNVMVAASFWLGMKWRRANKTAAWCSIVATAVLFYILPLLIPNIFPSLRSNSYLLKTTDPGPVVRTYPAREMDISQRRREIEQWQQLEVQDRAGRLCPAELKMGEKFSKTYTLEKKHIFWNKGAGNEDGRLQGKGILYLELIGLDKAGFDLSRNPYALNETIRIVIRTFVPFVIFIVVALLTAPDDKKRLDRFFVKMKTVVLIDCREDACELELSYANPHRFDSQKIFPNSNWEFDKWDKVDIIGFSVSVAVVFAIVFLLEVLVGLGG